MTDYKFEVKDSFVDFVAHAETPLSAQGPHFGDVMNTLTYLNVLMPMDRFQIASGINLWTVTATAMDDREFTATVSYTGGNPYYSIINAAASSQGEVEAFLRVLEAWGVVLESHVFKSVDVKWIH